MNRMIYISLLYSWLSTAEVCEITGKFQRKLQKRRLTKSASCFRLQWLQYILLSPQTFSPLKRAVSPRSCKHGVHFHPECSFLVYIVGLLFSSGESRVPRCRSGDENPPPRAAESKICSWNRSSPRTRGRWPCGSAPPWRSGQKGTDVSERASKWVSERVSESLPWLPPDWSDTGSSRNTPQHHVAQTLKAGANAQKKKKSGHFIANN